LWDYVTERVYRFYYTLFLLSNGEFVANLTIVLKFLYTSKQM
jgi:hypothetical protein